MTYRVTVLSLACLILACATTFGQSSRRELTSELAPTNSPAARAIASLSRLDTEVIIYRSLADFEDGRKLLRVPLATFEQHLRVVSAEVTPLLEQMPAGKLKNDLSNALDSYRDGYFWWAQSDEPRVVNIRSLSYATSDRTAADAAFHATLPYTVAIHWRHAHDYLARAERIAAR